MQRLVQVLVFFIVFTAIFAQARVPAELIGTWEVRHTALEAGHRYKFMTDGDYTYEIFKIVPGDIQVIQSERGKYSIESDRLTVKSQDSDNARTFRWRIERDPYVGDRILRLENSREKLLFYGSR